MGAEPMGGHNNVGGAVCVATAETKLIDTQVKAGTVVTKVKGAEVKVATSDMKGLCALAGASIDISTKESTTTAGWVELKGADVDIEATAEPTAQGASIQTGTATITGVQEKIKADVKTTISGTKVQAGVADVSGIKFGATAEASVEAAGLDVKVGTAQVSAIEASATASASASTEAKVSIGSARVTGFDGIGASASVTRSQMEILSAQVGISGHTGIQVSNATKVGCVSLVPGPPKLGFGKSILSFGFGGLDGGQSGTYAAIATVGNPEGSSRHGNSRCGGNSGSGEFSNYDSGPGIGVEGNTSEMSSARGSSGLGGGIQGHSGTCAGNTSVETFEGSHNECGQNSNKLLSDKNVLGKSKEGNIPETASAKISLNVPSVPLSGSISGGSTTIGVNSIFCSGTSHNHQSQDQTMTQDMPVSCDKIEDRNAKTGNSESVKLNEQPFHLRVFQTLEYDYFRDDKTGNASLSNKQTAVLTNASRQQLSVAKCDIQLQGTEAKLQAEINQLYPSLRSSGKPEANKTVEQITHSTIKKLNNEGKAGAHSPESSSTMSTNDSTNNLPKKKAKPFGPQKNIHTLDYYLMECPKRMVTLNSRFGGDIAGFIDPNNGEYTLVSRDRGSGSNTLEKYHGIQEHTIIGGEIHQTVYHSAAILRAHIPFMQHCILKCDHSGLKYTLEDHNITLNIPEGAVAENQIIHIEVDVTIYGSFTFLNNTQPISPIVWLCILEKDTKLKKPFRLILPHFLTGLTRDELCNHQVGFAKASHHNGNGEMKYEFHPCDNGYAVLESDHCCFYCLQANQSPELVRDAGYCLTRIEHSASPQRNEIYFIATYFLQTCIQALNEQFHAESECTISRHDHFKFEDETLHIKFIPLSDDQHVIALEPSTAQIKASDIDFWSTPFDQMQLKHRLKMYPPRVKMTVTMRNKTPFKLCVKVTGCSSDNQLDMDISFPLGVTPPSMPNRSQLQCQSHTIVTKDDTPKLKDAFEKLLPLAADWNNIGVLLGIKDNILRDIKHNEGQGYDRLREMLSEWLKIDNPPPTWHSLADAVKLFNAAKAEEIRNCFAE